MAVKILMLANSCCNMTWVCRVKEESGKVESSNVLMGAFQTAQIVSSDRLVIPVVYFIQIYIFLSEVMSAM